MGRRRKTRRPDAPPTGTAALGANAPADVGGVRVSRRLRVVLAVAIAIGGVAYVGNRLSPSSYAIVLRALGVEETGLVAGEPRPDRGDEFGWQTPLIQMAVRSGFARHDRTPPYFEDLRTIFALPLADWAAPFKPVLWGFFVLPPRYAYSLYQFALLALFLAGFALVFERQGAPPLEAVLLCLAVFFTPYVQYWWNGFGNVVLPLFPWAVLAATSRARPALKGLLVYWLATSWLLLYFYPPVAIPLGFVGLVWTLAFWPDLLGVRKLAVIAISALAAAATAWLYLREPLEVLGRTVYPGRRVSGGGGVELLRMASQFLPNLAFERHAPLVDANACELAMMGSPYVLLVLCLADYGRLRPGRGTAPAARRAMLVLAVGVALVWAWMTLPLPPWAGYPLLWHRVQPGRIVVAAGLLLFSLAFLAARTLGLVLRAHRLALFSGAVLAGWLLAKRPHGIAFLDGWRDWAIVPATLLVAVWARLRPARRARAHPALLAASAALGALSFGTYNPVQRTDQIFRRPDTELTRDFDARLAGGSRRYVVVPLGTSFFGHTGLPLVGLGYPSVTYSTFAPKLELWRRLFPDLPESDFQALFNNAGGIAVQDVEKPFRLPGTLLTVVPFAAVERLERDPAAISPGAPGP